MPLCPPLCPSCPRKPALGVGMAKRWPMSASLKDALIKNFPVPVTRFFFLPFSVPNLHPNIVNQNSPPPLLKHSNTRTPRVQHLPTRIDPLTSPLMKGRSSVFTSQVCVLLLCCCMLRKQSIYPAILHGRHLQVKVKKPLFDADSPQHSMASKLAPIAPHRCPVSDSCPLSRANNVSALGLSLRSASPGIALTHRLVTD